MADPKELPQLATELFDMSKEYLRQETIEPAKALGRHAGFGLGAGAILAFASIFLIMAVYNGLQLALPEGEWWVVLARGLTVLVAAGLTGILGWRMSVDDRA